MVANCIDRITPAYAGKSRSVSWTPTVVRDHPRVCGEKSLVNTMVFPLMGSPPNMRGKAAVHQFVSSIHGITPAYAGKSGALIILCCIAWDHPRICGEKGVHPELREYAEGSPPHMRGKVKRQQATAPPGQDHPRICGEKCHALLAAASAEGSPPRMRGKVEHVLQSACAEGITPAYAGKSRKTISFTKSAWDHPRVCGEKSSSTGMRWAKLGSPPHMRGKVLKNLHHDFDGGITPAYSGKSNLLPHTRCRSWDYPRICGEKQRTLAIQDKPQGSPPHMRGKAVRAVLR